MKAMKPLRIKMVDYKKLNSGNISTRYTLSKHDEVSGTNTIATMWQLLNLFLLLTEYYLG